MSLDIALRIATSSLMTTQVQIGVASSNISNADTAGYTVKTAKQVATVSGGVGTGTTITAITSNVDKLLLKSLMQATSALGAADTGNTYLDQLQALYGRLERNGQLGCFVGEHYRIAGNRHLVSVGRVRQRGIAGQCRECARRCGVATARHIGGNPGFAQRCRPGNRLVGRRRQ